MAIDGGSPVRSKPLPYGHQWITEEDIACVAEALRGDWITQGERVGEFEKRVAEYCGARYAVAVASGTAALHAACAVAGVSSGDEVITTPITFAATANAVIFCGGKPVFADVEEDTVNISPEEILKKITPQTKAILPVDFAGHPAEMDEIMAIARKNGLAVIEDACHALGAAYNGQKVGILADMTIFSFHPVKHITTGEGGMVLTDNADYYEQLRLFRHHCLQKTDPPKEPWYYEIHDAGHNYRITDFQCALGTSQMQRLDAFVSRRRELAAGYDAAFAGIPAIITPTERETVKAAYHIYVIRLRPELLKASRREIFDALAAENIGVNVHYIPLHLQPLYQNKFGCKQGDCPAAESYYAQAITLPIFPAMSDADAEDVIEAVRKVIRHYSE